MIKAYLRHALKELKTQIDDIPMQPSDIEPIVVALMELRKIVEQVVDQLQIKE